MSDVVFTSSCRPIRAWRAGDGGNSPADRAASLCNAFIAAAQADTLAARRLRRALRAERRRAGQCGRGYDLDRHTALARALAALARATGK